MVNMKIFKTLLECAFDLKVIHFHSKVVQFNCKNNGHSFLHKCDINTDKGGLHITLHEGHFEVDKYIKAEIKTSIEQCPKEDIVGLVKMQCQTEAFLGYDDYDKYHCECSLIK